MGKKECGLGWVMIGNRCKLFAICYLLFARVHQWVGERKTDATHAHMLFYIDLKVSALCQNEHSGRFSVKVTTAI